jgi:GWxTD domain-containing protein
MASFCLRTRSGSALWIAAALALPFAARALAGDTVDTRRFPKLAHLFLLPDEESLLNQLKDDKDRRAFQAVFWARRDPSPGTPANEFEDNVRIAWKHADERFSYPNQKGSETGCGQVIALLGPPEEVRAAGEPIPTPPPNADATTARGAGRAFDDMAYLREGPNRSAETWVYRDRPRLPYSFTGGELRVAFDPECRFAEGGIVADDLHRAAAALVTRPELAYTRGPDGRLLPPPAPAAGSPSAGGAAGVRSLLGATRSDFPLAAEPKLLMRTAKGTTYVAGLAQATPDASGARSPFSVAVQARDAAGQTLGTSSLDVKAGEPTSGALLGSWGLTLPPGHYALTVAAQLGERGSVTSLELDVPDFSGHTLAASPLVAYPDEPQAASSPADPYAALKLGPMRLCPRFGNVFASSDALMVVATVYGGKPDATSGKAELRSRFSILKDGRPVARGAEDVFQTPDAVASVGPIPLAGYAPGRYLVRLDVTDAVAGQSVRQEIPLEIRKP